MDNQIVRVDYEPATITADFDGMERKLRAMIEPFAGVTPEQAAQMDVKEAKACRSQLNAWSKELNEARKAVKREYNRPLQAFEARVKELDMLIQEPCAIIGEAITRREAQEAEERVQQLKQHYEELAPMLLDVLPFERVMEPAWANKTNFKKRFEELEEKVVEIVGGWDALQSADLFSPETAAATYWQTLSVGEVMRRDKELRAQHERVEAMRAAQSAIAENVAKEPEPEQETPQSAPERVEMPVFEECFDYQLTLRDVTKKQLDGIVQYLKENNIHGKLRRL